MDSLQFSEQSRSAIPRKAHALVFTSGKAGVGKTCIVTNVASAMVQRGARVCILDCDSGGANINVLLGLHPEFTLENVLKGEKSLREVLITTNEGIAVVPGFSRIAELPGMGAEQAKRLLAALLELETEYDFILIDTNADVGDNLLQFIKSAPCTFLIVTSESATLTDAFSLLKLLVARKYPGRLRVLVNLANDYPDATETYRRFASAVEKHLHIQVEYGGFVAADENLPKSAATHLPLVELASNSPASRCLFALADNILKYIGSEQPEFGLAEYWTDILAGAVPVPEEDTADSLDFPEPELRELHNQLALAGAQVSENNLPYLFLAEMKAQRLERSQLENFFSGFTQLFVEQFGHFPQNFRQLLYRWLESENYAAPRLLELVTTLEALYLSRYQQPLFSLENSAARLIAQTQGEEAKLRDLVQQLRAAYRQSFQMDVFDAQKEVLAAIQQADFTEERFEQLLSALREEFQQRFNKPYQGQAELLLESTAEELAAMAVDEKRLEDEIEFLTISFQQLVSRRDALIAAIKSGQNSNIRLNPANSVNG